MHSLKSKKILLISPIFFGYEKNITRELESRGAIVVWVADRPFKSIFLRALTTYIPWLTSFLSDRIYSKFLGSCTYDFDIVFVVNGQTLSPRILKNLKSQYSSAKFYLYLWDSFSNRSNSISKLKFFDYVSTFDPNDAKEHDLDFRPLFFSYENKKNEVDRMEFDWSFIGTNHSDRHSIINRMISLSNKKRNSYVYLYIPAKWVFWFIKIFNKNYRNASANEFKFIPLSKAHVNELFSKSKAILDIEHPKQYGLTMRTFEVIGAHKKLITTNKNIKNYDFYNSKNICIVDRESPMVPDDFFDSNCEDLSEELYYKYSISGWLDDVLSLKENIKDSA